ncbi:flagellar hook-associated protein FlgL [Motiliproteus sp. MSK22-1]|uniref:flagellar hook-associated protein FlgL n=1 Tax=Motiliproteus sp. MSK22-1 TaxID=1897630 RepID=UPI0009755F7E|nr:flagellar hook-associated protein FlgL [Motiliproteus sp. MSK22-1]OMH30010.1 flagellar hook-associated protein 3 [Motiliproteus sp. MSK22-1]
MRVSTQQIFNNAVAQMQKGQTNLAMTQERIASGKELLRPSDDPIAAAQILKLQREIARTDTFTENIGVSERRLSQEELTLDSIDTAADRMKELTIRAGSVTLTDADRKIIASELRQLQGTMLSLMNTKDAQGEYLFSGGLGHTQPFVQNGNGSFSYQGDDGQRFIQVGSELQIASSDSGRDAFVVIPDDIQVQLLGRDTNLITTPVFTDQGADTVGAAYSAFSEIAGDVEVVVRKIPGSNVGEYHYSIFDSSGAPVTAGEPPVLQQDILFDTTDATVDTVTFGGLAFDISALSGSSIELEKQPGTRPDPRVLSNEQILDSTAYLSFVETYGSDLNVAVTLSSNAGVAEYDYVITDSQGVALPGPVSISPVGPIIQPTQITINDGATDVLSFTLTPFTDGVDPANNLLTDDMAVAVSISNDPGNLITGAVPADPMTTAYSDFAAANGNVDVIFRNNAGVLEYDIQDGTATSVIGGFAALGAGDLSVPQMGIDLTVDAAAVALALPNPGDTTAGGSEITLGAQVNTVLSGQGNVTIRANEGHHSLLQTAEELISVLETPLVDSATRAALSTALAKTLEELDIAKEGNLQVRTQLGARTNSLDTAREVNADFKLFTESALSQLQDLDYAEAIAEFSLQEMALQASQATFARVNSLSLFNFL